MRDSRLSFDWENAVSAVKSVGKMAVAETSFVKKNHQIATIVNQKITQKLIEKVPMTTIAESLSVSTSTVIHKLKEFKFKTDLSYLPEHMSWDEYSFKKGKMSFIAQDFDSRQVITILDGRTQARIDNHFLHYSRPVRCRVIIISMDMLVPTMTWLGNFFHALKSSSIAFTLYNISAGLCVVFVFKSWSNQIESLMNIGRWNATGNSFNKIVEN